MPISPEAFLREQGLEPLSWDETLQRIELELTSAGADAFRRRHRAFISYPTAHTARAFYDLAAEGGLLPLLAGFRFERLVALARAVREAAGALDGLSVLDVGAGSGHLSAWMRAEGARVTTTDLAPGVRAELARLGHRVLEEGEAPLFDLVLCADSLGEIHADEDDWLADPAHADLPEYPGELEARYGLAEKLAPLRPRLAPGGAVLVFEPAPLAHFWKGAARAVESAGWRAEVLGPAPAWGLRLTIP